MCAGAGMDTLDCQGLPMAPALLFVRIKGARKTMTPKILLVDNDREYRHMIASIVRRIGYDVIQAEEIAEAIERSASDRPALVMMAEDVAPAGCLKTHRFPVGIPIVVYTAQQTDTCMDEALANGAAAILSKPISSADLRVVLRKQLQTSINRPRPIPSPGFVNESAPMVG
jgi:two-component system, chemotaxis family, chemotaxis protein CheY